MNGYQTFKKICYNNQEFSQNASNEIEVFSWLPVDTRRKLNVYKTFRRRPGRLLNVICTFNLRPGIK